MPRELSIIYGSTTVGGADTDFLLHGEVSVQEGPDLAVCSFTAICIGTSEADFAANISTFETAFRDPRRRLRVVLGSATLYDWNPADTVNTGFNQAPTFTKVGDPAFDSGRSCRYDVRIEIDLPADTYDQSGRRTSRVVLDFSPARRRTLTITGEYRALTTEGSARDQYDTNIAAYGTALIATARIGAGGTWELVEENSTTDDADKICEFTRVYEHKIADQALGLRDHADIVRDDLRAKAVLDHPGDSPGKGARRLVFLDVSYSCWVDSTRTTDLIGLWENTIRPLVEDRALAAFRASSGGIVHEEPEFDGPNNRISAQLRMVASGGSGVAEYRITKKIHDLTGETLVPAWTGNPYSKYRYQGPARRLRTTTEITRVVGRARRIKVGGGGDAPSGLGGDLIGLLTGGLFGFGGPPGQGISLQPRIVREGGAAGAGAAPGAGGGGAAGGKGQWVVLERDNEETPLLLGDPLRGNALPVTDLTSMTIEEFYVPLPVPPAVSPRDRVFPGLRAGG